MRRCRSGTPMLPSAALDRDGILSVSAKEKLTGLERRITIDRATSRYDKDELGDARRRIAELFDDEDAGDDEDADAAPSPAAPEAGTAADADVTALIAKARAKLDTALDEDRAELQALIEMIKDCEARGDAAGRNEASAQIRDLLFYLEV
jgi:molecular chaperone DnaK (HSP70)